jgi:hypothetical protein
MTDGWSRKYYSAGHFATFTAEAVEVETARHGQRCCGNDAGKQTATINVHKFLYEDEQIWS